MHKSHTSPHDKDLNSITVFIWNPDRLAKKVPYVAAAVGGRRMGKSTLVTHLLKISTQFDLVISFVGTTACSPEMKELLETRYDARFQFAEWNQSLMDQLMTQQEALKARGIQRQVCVLIDDIILSGRDEDALSHLCLRGRHFNISVLACAVSYTTLPKRCRRSLDALFLFSCPMAGDAQILCSEYAQKSRMARYLLQNLPEWTCLVMETLERRQKLYFYRVPMGLSPQKPTSSSDSKSETMASSGLPAPHPVSDHPVKNSGALSHTELSENPGCSSEDTD